MNIYNTVYKTINNVNGKFYIGVHSTNNPNDSYLGSGTAINCAIEIYGEENFTKEILHIFDTREEAYKKEAELVTEDFINNPRTYNIALGGEAGVMSEAHRQSIITSQSKPKPASQRKKMSESHMGRKHTKETRKKISETRSGLPKTDVWKKSLNRVVTCHCGKTGSGPTMKRWHFDNCRH